MTARKKQPEAEAAKLAIYADAINDLFGWNGSSIDDVAERVRAVTGRPIAQIRMGLNYARGQQFAPPLPALPPVESLPLAVTIKQAAKLVGMSDATIRQAIGARQLVAHFPTSKTIILVDDLRKWIEASPEEHGRSRFYNGNPPIQDFWGGSQRRS